MNNSQADLEDVFLWPDATWCYRYQREAYSHMSDDYQILYFDSPEYNLFMENLE